MQSAGQILEILKPLASEINVAGMTRFGIISRLNLGVSVKDLRKLARQIEASQSLAEELWALEYRELRILATLIGEPGKISKRTMDRWVRDLDSWDICDACCCNLFDRTPHAEQKVYLWSTWRPEFQKRAAFATIAGLASHSRDLPNETFQNFLPIIERESSDDRNYVRKAVNWALRGIGKRNLRLNKAAVAAARQIQQQNSRIARWIATDALRELTSDAVLARLTLRERK
jgi:3-methyladenine DNA glycosylase AlkD